MIASMTGYGKAEGTIGSRKFTVEIKALNSKQLDINLRMPSVYREKELEFRNWLAERLFRGKVEVGIFYEADAGEQKTALNRPLFERYAAELREIAVAIEQPQPDYIGAILRIPEVMRPEREELDEEEWEGVMALAEAAFTMFHGYRHQEGAGLFADFNARIESIMAMENALTPILQQRMERIKARINGSLENFIDTEKIDRNRFEQEVIYYLEKLDVNEERQRLVANCTYFLEIMEQGSQQGKKLGFIAQEIGREINTLGSKANDAEIQRTVVLMKDELEKIKEQVLNVL
jgi:uncharacterized protein (TIGR00255 family)